MASILLIGYSVRMLAELAVRAGYDVFALDYFGDTDLRTLCPGLALLRDFPEMPYSPAALVRIARTLRVSAVVYGASFENYPDLVAQLAKGRHLFGNIPDTLRRVRDPLQLAVALRAGGFAFPETVASGNRFLANVSRRWLRKPLRSGGGRGVRPWQGGSISTEEILQEWIRGMAGSAAFVADGRQAVLLGVTEQLVGRRAFGATGFRYCGNLVPPRLPLHELRALVEETCAIANYLTRTFGLQGVNGLDFIWSEGRVWTVEVNPRPSASLELLEAVYGIPVFAVHVRSFAGELPPWDLTRVHGQIPAAGKAILYAPADLVVGNTDGWMQRGIRDVPHPGDFIRRGHPICTLLTTGPSPSECLRKLHAMARETYAQLYGMRTVR